MIVMVKRIWQSLCKQKSGLVGLVIILLLIVIAVLAPVLSPADPNLIVLTDRLLPPGSVSGSGYHLFGTDSLGRDVLSRMITGARVSLLIGFCAALLSVCIGTLLGLISGYYGGWFDVVLMRLADIQLAFPFTLLALTFIATLGGGLVQLILIMGIFRWVNFARITRAEALSLREREFVQAAKAIGFRSLPVMLRHILPNVIAPVIVSASFVIASNILSETTLSFLGLGVEASIPTWGSLLAEGRDLLTEAWWIATLPGIAVMITVLGVNLFGDWLRDFLDPKMQ